MLRRSVIVVGICSHLQTLLVVVSKDHMLGTIPDSCPRGPVACVRFPLYPPVLGVITRPYLSHVVEIYQELLV